MAEPNMLGGISAILQAFASVDAFEKTKRTELDNAGELMRSSRMEEANAVAVRQRGAMEAGRKRMEGSQLAGQQKLAYALGNLDSGSGTAAQTMSSSAVFNELDAATLQNNAIRQAFGHEESARRYAKASKKITDYYLAPDRAGFSDADNEFGLKLASSALGAAASFGMGGG